MASADQLLAQQANQTMALMQAIGKNTQQEFANRSAVQQAELSTGIQVASQMEQYKMNDARLEAMKQEMGMRLQEHEWRKKQQAFQETLQPLEFKARELQLQNQFRSQAEQRMRPFLADIQGEFQGLIIDNPDAAPEAQSVYAQTIDGILNKAIADPNYDMAKAIESEKAKMRGWIGNKRKEGLTNKSQALLEGADAALGGALSGGGYNPTQKLKEIEARVTQSPEEISRNASIYAAFGGNPKDFALKHDPTTRTKLDSVHRISMATGEIPPVEVLSQMPPEMQESIIERAEQIASLTKLNQASTSLVNQMKELRMQDSELRDKELTPVNEEAIKGIQDQLKSISDERNKIMGIEILKRPLPDGDAVEPVTDLVNRIKGSQQASDYTTEPLYKAGGDLPSKEDVSESDRRTKGLRPYKMIASLGGIKAAEEFKKLFRNDELNEDSVRKLIDGASENQIKDLFSDPNIVNILEDIGYSQYVGNSYKEGTGKTITPIGNALAAISAKGSDQNKKKEAIKFLKSELPSIILRYTTQ